MYIDVFVSSYDNKCLLLWWRSGSNSHVAAFYCVLRAYTPHGTIFCMNYKLRVLTIFKSITWIFVAYHTSTTSTTRPERLPVLKLSKKLFFSFLFIIFTHFLTYFIRLILVAPWYCKTNYAASYHITKKNKKYFDPTHNIFRGT